MTASNLATTSNPNPPDEDEDEDDDGYGNDQLTRLLARRRTFDNKRAVAYKTVQVFGGLTRRKLWLRDGKTPHTDGHEIQVPFGDPEFYRRIEHLLGHILFRTDVRAKQIFVTEYTKKVDEIATKNGVQLNAEQLSKAIAHIINVLEAKRVNSLWSMLYPGSAELMAQMDQEECAPYVNNAHDNLLTLFTCLANGLEVPPGELDRFRPYFVEAMKKVERRGFVATLATSKWLVTNIVSEILRRAKGAPPPPMPGNGTGGFGAGLGGQGSGGGGGGGGSSGGGGGGNAWQPPGAPPGVNTKDRAKALQQMVDALGALDDKLQNKLDPVKESKYAKRGATQEAMKQAAEALKAEVNKPEEMEDLLDKSEDEMEDLVKQVQEALRQEPHDDEWLTKDAMAKVNFVDVKRGDVEREGIKPEPLEPEDQQTVQRLRATFNRIMGKTKTTLAEAGTEIDVSAYIAGKVSGVPEPCFRHEERGQGFKAMLLIDKSGSMAGDKNDQVERAVRIITRALKFPFVELQVWGFQSHEAGEVTIIRYEKNLDVFTTSRSRADGSTPLHVALRLAARQMEKGSEAKQLFVLTDGFPCHSRRDGRAYSTAQLMMFCREEVAQARQEGIGVTGIMLGHRGYAAPGQPKPVPRYDLNEKQLGFMFGHRRNWNMMDPDRLGIDLVRLVTTSFSDYLSRR